MRQKIPEGDPAGVQYLIERTNDIGGRAESDAEIDVDVAGFVGTLRYRVCIDPEETHTDSFEIGDPGLLGHFTTSCSLNGGIVSLDVATGLEPSIQPRMVDQQQ